MVLPKEPARQAAFGTHRRESPARLLCGRGAAPVIPVPRKRGCSGGGRGARLRVWAMWRAVRICRRCDRGHRYCPPCAPVARRERLKRAAALYQQSAAWRANHKRRQQEYLARGEARGKMTHQGSPERRVAEHSPPRPADASRDRAHRGVFALPTDPDRLRCAFCGREVRDAPVPRATWRRPRVRRGPRLPIGQGRRRLRGRRS